MGILTAEACDACGLLSSRAGNVPEKRTSINISSHDNRQAGGWSVSYSYQLVVASFLPPPVRGEAWELDRNL